MHEKRQLPKNQRRRSFQLRNALLLETRHVPEMPNCERVRGDRNVQWRTPRSAAGSCVYVKGASTLKT
jgi:hypothetical protein